MNREHRAFWRGVVVGQLALVAILVAAAVVVLAVDGAFAS